MAVAGSKLGCSLGISKATSEGIVERISLGLSSGLGLGLALGLCVGIFAGLAPMPASAALNPGQAAPDFTAQASIAGEVVQFSLSQALKKGPVVLYFFPAAFTTGCTIEAHDFAEAVDEYANLGATVIGVSGDDIETQKRFSQSECRGKFAVASDADRAIMKAYDATLTQRNASRISYVIGPDSKILYQYASPQPDKHVSNTMSAVKEWADRHKAQDK